MAYLRIDSTVRIRTANEQCSEIKQSWGLAEPSITHNEKLLSCFTQPGLPPLSPCSERTPGTGISSSSILDCLEYACASFQNSPGHLHHLIHHVLWVSTVPSWWAVLQGRCTVEFSIWMIQSYLMMCTLRQDSARSELTLVLFGVVNQQTWALI